MSWKFTQDRPIYLQIIDYIMIEIFSGKYKPGEKIASVRDLSIMAGVNPNTMQKALQEMENLKLLISKRTSGRYVTEDIEVIKKFREEIIRNKVRYFVDELTKLGYSINEIFSIISKEYSGENDIPYKNERSEI